jgi:hypothetical protein
MAQSDLECANIALTKIGAAKITALADATETAIACNLVLDPLKKSLLRMSPWNFAIKRANLSPTFVNITSIVDSGGNYKINTASTSGLANGDRVTIGGVVGNEGANGSWIIEALVANTSFELVDSVFAGTYVSGGTWTEAPAFGYTYQVAMPSDWIRTLRVNDQNPGDYRMEANFLYVDDYPVELKYVYNVTDYTQMDVAFYDLLSTALALQVSYKISASSTLLEQLRDIYRRQMAKVRFDDATEDPAEVVGADDWVMSRITYTGGLVRDPLTS